ncbi:MAG: hypothetical protein RSG52_13465 [Terrisporobacter sp.]|uniref:hypothetical protein n=1 Tax=Terrisporobacter sp. TaxID=1965305 RepID=UPI002FCB34E2
MLETPLGLLKVYKNNEIIEYGTSPLPLKPIEISSYEVDARYLIEIDKSKINPGDVIRFCIEIDIRPEVDGGDCLVEAMFESDDLFLALGGYDINNHEDKYKIAYTFSVIDNGLEAKFIDLQYIDDFLVAIAWSNTEKDDYYTSVWFSADPCI